MNAPSVAGAAIAALVQVAVLAGIPFAGYFAWHRWRHRRSFAEVARRVGLQGCSLVHLAIAAAISCAGVIVIVLWRPGEAFMREGLAQNAFAGAGLSPPIVVAALLHGVVQTAFAEELLFRGLIAGSLSRRFRPLWANVLQATLFLLPHLLILTVMPGLAWLLPLVFAGGLVMGWLRLRSGSIIGPWLMHASGNVAMALSLAAHTAA